MVIIFTIKYCGLNKITKTFSSAAAVYFLVLYSYALVASLLILCLIVWKEMDKDTIRKDEYNHRQIFILTSNNYFDHFVIDVRKEGQTYEI